MNNKIRNIVVTILFVVILGGFMFACILAPDNELSYAERRKLNQLPAFSFKDLFSGKLFTDFEDYSLDQFVLRDDFRAFKAFVKFNLFGQKDNNNIYIIGDQIYKMEYPTNDKAVLNIAKKYNEIAQKYFSNFDKFYTIIPDKNYYVQDNGYLHLDYDKIGTILGDNVVDMEYVNIFPLLGVNDYYKTDLHWKQESLLPVANKLLSSMGTNTISSQFTNNVLNDFKGGYYGQAGLKLPSESLTYLTNPIIDNCVAIDKVNNKVINIYDQVFYNSIDPYNIYLNGPMPIIEITNPNATNDKELIIIRDSFSSSLAPLLMEGYAKITLVDLRYISTEMVGNYIDLEGDITVLFALNTTVINTDNILK